jgi:hypothetical protein
MLAIPSIVRMIKTATRKNPKVAKKVAFIPLAGFEGSGEYALYALKLGSRVAPKAKKNPPIGHANINETCVRRIAGCLPKIANTVAG